MRKEMKRIKKGIGLLIAVTIVLSPIVSLATEVGGVNEMVYPCHTECKLNHNHQKEICEIDHYGRFLNWAKIPFVWEYNNTDTASCWQWGLWEDGLCYTTPENTFDIDVRNKVAIHRDGTYMYLNVVQATVNNGQQIGNDLKFTIDGQLTRFRLVTMDGNSITQLTTPGTYEIVLKHENNAVSGTQVVGSKAYMYVNNTGNNSEYEVKIPLAELKVQNPAVDLDNINEISFHSWDFMVQELKLTGISTYPYVLAVLCIVGVAFFVYKKTKKEKVVGV